MSAKFDLFSFLDKLNHRDFNAYTELSAEDKKAVSPLVVMRWLSGTSDPAQLLMLNEYVNKYVFNLGTEKELLFKLMAACCSGGVRRVSWIKGPSAPKNTLSADVVRKTYECSTREAVSYLEVLTELDIMNMAEDLGWSKEELKKLKLEISNVESRSTAGKVSKSKD